MNWSSIANNAEVYQGITINHAKAYYDTERAIQFIKDKRDMYNRVSNYRLKTAAGGAVASTLIDKILKKLVSAGSVMYSCLTTLYSVHYSQMSSLYSDLYDIYNEQTSRNGLFVVTTRMTVTGAPVSNCNVTEEYYDGNGCLITVLNYNE